jgi:hypothetical protein
MPYTQLLGAMMRTFNSRRAFRFERLENRLALSADFDGLGTVDAADLEIWQDNYGTVDTTATQMPGDADGDFDVDGRDFLAWQREFGSYILVAPRNVEARAVGPTSIEVTWDASLNATDYLIARRQPDTESAFTTIAPNVVGTSYTDSTGLLSDTLYEYLVVAQRNPSSGPSEVAQAITNKSNLTAYRPQGIYDLDDNSTPDPIYDPFPKRPVSEQDEFHNALGPGIRINGDDDDQNGIADFTESGTAITRENDLIEVKIDRLPGHGNQVLQVTGALRLYYDHDKDTPVTMFGNQTELLPFTNNSLTVFVEWQSSSHGTDILSLLDATTFATHDSLRFHSFRSFTVIFGGRGQNPHDTDGDGNIRDVVNGANREGIFGLAQDLYDTGYDVMAFDEADYTLNAESLAEYEIRNAIDNRFVSPTFNGGVSIMGYSQGGGVVQNMIEDELDPINNPQYLPIFGVYLDAVIHDGAFAETDWPDAVFYMLNIYETRLEFPPLGGGDIDDNEVLGGQLEEVNVTTDPNFNNNLDHFNVDDDFDILNLIFTRQQQLLFR